MTGVPSCWYCAGDPPDEHPPCEACEERAGYKRALEAFESLALRLYCHDYPDESTVTEIDRWAAGLPEDERAAFNAMLGENFGGRDYWDGDHPISALVLTLDDDGLGGES